MHLQVLAIMMPHFGMQLAQGNVQGADRTGDEVHNHEPAGLWELSGEKILCCLLLQCYRCTEGTQVRDQMHLLVQGRCLWEQLPAATIRAGCEDIQCVGWLEAALAPPFLASGAAQQHVPPHSSRKATLRDK